MIKSIQTKILIHFSIVIFIALTALLYGSYRIIEQNTIHILGEELIATKKNLDLYLKQYFTINDAEFKNMPFCLFSQNIADDLNYGINEQVEIYDVKGIQLTKNNKIYVLNNDDDLIEATKDHIAYSINKVDKKVIIALSFPIKINNNTVGIIRYYRNHTNLYDNICKLKYFIFIFAIIIFIIIFIVSLILSEKIARPIKKLTESSKSICKGNFNVNLNTKSKDEIGTLTNVFNLMICHIKKQIETIENEKNKLLESQKQTKSFFDNVTHELKTPLTTILGYAQMIKDNGFTDEDFFNKGLGYIIDQSHHLNSMVIQILELSKTNNTQYNYSFEKLNISDLINNACNEMKFRFNKYNMDICYHVENDLLVNGDKIKLKEVIINLLDNSMKYGEVNSKIYVCAFKDNNQIIFKIRNDGDPIPETHLKNIFKPFYRSHKNTIHEKGSSGLGLAIVKNIIDNHKGLIKITSQPIFGTEVTITLDEYTNNPMTC